MIVTKDIQKYIAFSDDSAIDALKKISDNKSRILFIVSEQAILLGSVSDGDIRRWLTQNEVVNLNVPIKSLMNTQVNFLPLDTSKEEIAKLFINGVDCIPLVDCLGRLVKLAFQKKDGFIVQNKEVSQTSPCFIIAEIGNNHQGDIRLAKKLVDYAVEAGADCVKFQMRHMESLYRNRGNFTDDTSDLATQYTLDLLAKYQLNCDELKNIFDYCHKNNVIPLCTPWDIKSLAELEQYNMSAYKVASADLTNFALLEAVAKTGKPFFCSTGMANEDEIKEAVSFLENLSANYILLHCNSTYPTPFKDVNLNYLARLRQISNKLVGYSGHERGIAVPIAAVAMGAKVIEKHITLDVNLEGADHKASLLPNEFREMVRQIRNVEQSLGPEFTPRVISQGEKLNRENLAKSLVANMEIQLGSIIERNMVDIKSPGQGIQPNRINELIGKRCNRKIPKGGFFFESDINGATQQKQSYDIARPKGIPVRYHDFQELVSNTTLDFVEFHLSYKDLNLDIEKYFDHTEEINFAVHAPELFESDHILDLGSLNDSYRKRSISELSKVIEITRALNRYFPNCFKPTIIINAGGWSQNGFIEPELKAIKYDLVADSINQIDHNGVQIAIQTMPPFPWHFGGQSHHNLFVDPDEITNFCALHKNIKVCFDTSHSMMACNFYGWNFLEFAQKISPNVIHLHIADAIGVDGEGIELGEGDINFNELSKVLNQYLYKVPFVPEVWQGHKNSGEGFWKALSYLETYL